VNAECDTPIKIRQFKYLNNVVEQNHWAIKRIIRPMLGFKDFRCACVILSGIEILQMIAKGQMKHTGGVRTSHLAKYAHHSDGEAHFFEDGKVKTEVRRKSVPLGEQLGTFLPFKHRIFQVFPFCCPTKKDN